MAESNFVDYVTIYCRSGKGGSVILHGNRNDWTLLHLRYQRHVFATDGQPGAENKSFGKDGQDAVIEVPMGTVVYDAENGEYLCEITEHDQKVVLLKGGRGGLGNWHFRTSTNQAPRYSQPGEPALERKIVLELKMLADVGLVGFPNAGKSTLLSSVSAAKPKIADYPFTTMEPNLGLVPYRDNRSFVIADIPGIIEGAAEGRGLGLRFLRHIERNSTLLFMIPADSSDIRKDYDILLNELGKYNPEMLDKQRLLAITKCDMLDEELIDQMRHELPDGVPTVFISAVANQGLDQLKDMLWAMLNDESNRVQTFTHRNLDVSKGLEDDYEEADPFGHDDYTIEGVSPADLELDWE